MGTLIHRLTPRDISSVYAPGGDTVAGEVCGLCGSGCCGQTEPGLWASAASQAVRRVLLRVSSPAKSARLWLLLPPAVLPFLCGFMRFLLRVLTAICHVCYK